VRCLTWLQFVDDVSLEGLERNFFEFRAHEIGKDASQHREMAHHQHALRGEIGITGENR
jgi:hypothetical protein